MKRYKADLATERERHLTTARANQTTGLNNGRARNWEPEVEFSPFRALSWSTNDVPVLLLNQSNMHEQTNKEAINS